MMGALKAMLSTPKIVQAGIDTADALAFTPEERAAFLLEYAKATAPMNLARRWIAFVITGLWAFCCLLALAFLLFEADETFGRISVFMADNINTPFSIVMAFYFLAHVMSRGKK